MWSLQSNVTYVATPAQSWIDDYLAWLNSGQCCKYDKNTLQVSGDKLRAVSWQKMLVFLCA
jgi:hypothetical protein